MPYKSPPYVVDIRTDCWIWSRARNACGYGIKNNGTKCQLAHRWMYELKRGAVPPGKELDHLCRNRACVNPAHLQPVTHTTNVRRGNLAKFNRSDIAQIRRLRSSGLTQQAIADKFRVRQPAISKVLLGLRHA